MSRLITRIANASARVASRITNELVFGTMTATSASATMTINTFAGWLLSIGAHSRPNRPVGLTARISAIGAYSVK